MSHSYAILESIFEYQIHQIFTAKPGAFAFPAVRKKEQIAAVRAAAVWTTLMTADFNMGIKL